MTIGKILGYIGLTILIVFVVFVILFARSCNNGGLYQAGSGLGSVTTIENYRYQQQYYEKYADTFLAIFPEYKVPNDDPSAHMTSGYKFINMTKFYFDKSPKEIYCVQWQGIDVRMAYNVDRDEMIIENPRDKVYIDKTEKERMSKRLRAEVIDKLDSIIANSVDKDSVLLKHF
ncbi:hypothetical protein [Parasegetibacter sp. NRK P23]|uniref:hypothetical protein n=1 Tax=Parasegetibacter sp. NRK P23 TaxID=2942999 RepID=UPI002042BFE0|nr:hypothetical protein [Parasegetibacter sp. NRK P23]MCM5530246.1 hypothetical protein [Parasegetibacter sp. NRK P23]